VFGGDRVSLIRWYQPTGTYPRLSSPSENFVSGEVSLASNNSNITVSVTKAYTPGAV
jgi:hypothetical protein